MNHLDLFSGIGGFAIAVDTVWPGSTHTFCDNDTFCQAVLNKHWPNSKIYGDIRELAADTRGEKQRGIPSGAREAVPAPWRGSFDLITGGFPCQPFSQAGKRKGTDDDRHLWPEMFRVIRAFTPTWVVAENVRGLLTLGGGVVFEQVCADLEGAGYEVQPLVIPACAVNAPHRRDRVWFVANRKGAERNGERAEQGWKQGRPSNEDCDAADAAGIRRHGEPHQWQGVQRDELARGEAGTGDKPSFNVTNDERWSRLPGHEDEAIGGRGEARQEHCWGAVAAPHPTGEQAHAPVPLGFHPESRLPDWGERWERVAAATCVRGVDDELPPGLDGRAGTRSNRAARLKALGNAIVPAVAIEIMKAIQWSEFHPS